MEHKAQEDRPLQGLRILIADDEFLIATILEETFGEAGAETVSAGTLPAALVQAQQETLSAAVLDVRLGRQTTEAVADLLTSRKVPFVFYSGYSLPDGMRARFPDAAVLIKPVRPDAFIEALVRLTSTQHR
jgi:CheY-like chemotaxis protein